MNKSKILTVDKCDQSVTTYQAGQIGSIELLLACWEGAVRGAKGKLIAVLENGNNRVAVEALDA